jgi:3-deoxy-D-manno-octulosonate 8-phosphate phosphatase (KDO 8-P phosphatase)
VLNSSSTEDGPRGDRVTALSAPRADALERARQIRLLLTDCDGVLTDGGVYYSAAGEELKRFSVRDGMGIERLREFAGIETGIVTREDAGPVVARAGKLAIAELHTGAHDKLAVVRGIAERRQISARQIAFVGDDANDLSVMRAVGFSACPADAAGEVLDIAHYVCRNRGGHGALREVAELLIAARDFRESR